MHPRKLESSMLFCVQTTRLFFSEQTLKMRKISLYVKYLTLPQMNDIVKTLPIENGKLWLYCLKLSHQIVILGNGGGKEYEHV